MKKIALKDLEYVKAPCNGYDVTKDKVYPIQGEHITLNSGYVTICCMIKGVDRDNCAHLKGRGKWAPLRQRR